MRCYVLHIFVGMRPLRGGNRYQSIFINPAPFAPSRSPYSMPDMIQYGGASSSQFRFLYPKPC